MKKNNKKHILQEKVLPPEAKIPSGKGELLTSAELAMRKKVFQSHLAKIKRDGVPVERVLSHEEAKKEGKCTASETRSLSDEGLKEVNKSCNYGLAIEIERIIKYIRKRIMDVAKSEELKKHLNEGCDALEKLSMAVEKGVKGEIGNALSIAYELGEKIMKAQCDEHNKAAEARYKAEKRNGYTTLKIKWGEEIYGYYKEFKLHFSEDGARAKAYSKFRLKYDRLKKLPKNEGEILPSTHRNSISKYLKAFLKSTEK